MSENKELLLEIIENLTENEIIFLLTLADRLFN